MEVIQENCPPPEGAIPPQERTSSDYIELQRKSCFGPCPEYSVRLYRTGEVRWRGQRFVEVEGEAHSQIAPGVANQLIERFRNPEMWGLCARNYVLADDGSTTVVELQLGKQRRRIENYVGSAGASLNDLELALDKELDSHRWRHGDPSTESLSFIFEEYLPKPGYTALISATRERDLDKVESLLATHPEINATDSSGWTALMYAATRPRGIPLEGEDTLKALLAAGANPNHASPNGDTPLMVSALGGWLPKAILASGAAINAQNHQGVSPLMLVSKRGQLQAIREYLAAGADVNLRDYRRHTALDYARSRYCIAHDRVKTWGRRPEDLTACVFQPTADEQTVLDLLVPQR